VADACNANPQSSPQCPGYVTQQNTTAVTTTALPVPSVGNEDVAKLLTTPQLTSDPIVNQAIAKPEQSQQAQQTQPLGQGLTAQQPQQRQQARSTTQQQRTAQGAQQKAVANAQKDPQDIAMASMAEVPGFAAYQEVKIPDAMFYKVEDIYRKATIQDNARALRQLNQRSDRIHKEMVDEQYRR